MPIRDGQQFGGLRREGLRLVEDDASSSKGAVVRATSRARERETHHYIHVYRERSPVLAARQSFEVMHPDSQGQAELYRQLYIEYISL